MSSTSLTAEMVDREAEARKAGFTYLSTTVAESETRSKSFIGMCGCLGLALEGFIVHWMNWSLWMNDRNLTLEARLSCQKHRETLTLFIPRTGMIYNDPPKLMRECVEKGKISYERG